MSKRAKLLANILRAEINGNDLIEDDNFCINVCAETPDNKIYSIGHVSGELVYENPGAARAAIARIKFGKR